MLGPQTAPPFQAWVWRLCEGNFLNTELPQMMVEMFVHENSPLLRGHLSEKAVWVSRASCGAARDHTVNQSVEPVTFREEVSIVEHCEARHCWRISSHGGVATEGLGFDITADKPSDQQARWKHVAQSLFDSYREVRYCLGRIHLA